MSDAVVSIKNLTKIYANGFQALKGINLDIHRGEIFGLLGPNGAGKTTLINVIAGLAKRTSGEVMVLGKDVDRDYKFTRSKIGVVQQEINNDPFMKLHEVIELQGGYYGLRNLRPRVNEILKKVHLYEKRDVIGRFLSGGMKRRVMIAKALIHDPEVIFLDEPTAGVDVELRSTLWDVIRELKAQGKTIILTTHYLEEAQELSDRIAFINGGEIKVVAPKAELLAKYGGNLNEAYMQVITNGEKKS